MTAAFAIGAIGLAWLLALRAMIRRRPGEADLKAARDAAWRALPHHFVPDDTQ